MRVSLIVSTLGRTTEITKLLRSLQSQDYSKFEVIIVDQNDDNRLEEIVEQNLWSFPICRVSDRGRRGSCRGRNLGELYATGDILLFPDDDCWYPPWFLRRGVELTQQLGCSSISGRAADEKTGESINGRFETRKTMVDRKNVWTTQIEWTVFFRRESFRQVGGFDESLGPGASTPWGANEGQDLTLRMLAKGHLIYYDPDLFAYHTRFFSGPPNSAVIRKGRSYARGYGYVLRRHQYGTIPLLGWLVRPAARSLLSLAQGDRKRFAYYINVAIGRLEGWLGFTFGNTRAAADK